MASLAARRIARPALAERICDGLDSGSVLLVAGPGYGKTLALEEALARGERRAVWLSCAEAGGEGRRLLGALLAGLRATVPGLADVVGESLAAASQPVDVAAATGALLAELRRLLVEPLAIVFDDAERIEAEAAALGLVELLLKAPDLPLAVAVATRRPLPLELAKLRASGGLVEIGPAELGFGAAECEELLRLRQGRSPSVEEVEGVLARSEGWPMGVALSDLAGGEAGGDGPLPGGGLFEYLAEEVLAGLDPRTRLALVDSSVPETLTPELAVDLGLAPGFLDEVERRGLFLRRLASGDRAYHPLFREFLLRRLEELRPPAEVAALHGRAAAAMARGGRPAEAVGHWTRAGEHERALEYLVGPGGEAVRTSPGLVAEILAAMPAALRERPEHLLLEAQLLWIGGQHQRALAPLRAATAGFDAAGDSERAWIARLFLADTLILFGAFPEVPAVAEGWQAVSAPVASRAARAVAWYAVASWTMLGSLERAEELREILLRDPDAGQFAFFDVISRASVDLAAGRSERALALLLELVADLELGDPFGRLSYAEGMVLAILRTFGERAAGLEWIDRCERDAERTGVGFAVRDFHLQRASLLAQEGRLADAEAELTRAGERSGAGWRALYEAEAQAHIALLRGDSGAAVAAAQRALASSEAAPLPWLARVGFEMPAVLAEAGALEVAAEELAARLATLDERFPGAGGRLHRAWLLASRACLEQRRGESEAACRTIVAAWGEAGPEAGRMVRAQWPAVRPVLWQALADGALGAAEAIAELEGAFPQGEALAALADHPEPSVRRAALRAALAADHPAALGRLRELGEDDDEEVVAAAAATAERLREAPPPLRFELLGGFRVRRGGWALDEGAWQRPMAARVVRFLLIQGEVAVPEDALFEAFWADRPADSARQHLTVAVSRARKVLDLPGASRSAIEARERTYRLCLRERDGIDAVEFEAAARAALVDRGRGRRAGLDRAAALWGGDPLPEDRYETWAAAWRERLLGTYAELLAALIESQAAGGEVDEQIRTARRLLEVEPLNEAAHRSLIAAYARSGRTSYALRQYLECRRALVVELGVEPSAETSRLQARVLAGEPV